MLTHNFGHFDATLDHVIGAMSAAKEDTLSKKDKSSQRMAERKHVAKEGGKKTHRAKKSCRLQSKRDKYYDPGCEPI